MHGYGIASWIESATDEVLRVEEGSLYPALYRMVQKGWIKGEWGISENNRRAKFYRLTKAAKGSSTSRRSAGCGCRRAVSRAVGGRGDDGDLEGIINRDPEQEVDEELRSTWSSGPVSTSRRA